MSSDGIAGASTRRSRLRTGLTSLALVAIVVAAWLSSSHPIHARAMAIAAAALVLWLSEIVPPYVPTLVLLAAIPFVLGPLDPAFRWPVVLEWAIDPVLALFFGGFALGAAATRHGLDAYVARRAVVLSRHHRRRLLALVMGATAALSMWMSNIAAAAMMLAAIRPHLGPGRSESHRRALLLGVAVAANVSGMATPIGTGPNAIAIASLESRFRITFDQWMAFALPLTVGTLALGFLLIVRLYRVEGTDRAVDMPPVPLSGRAKSLVVLFALAVIAWLTEPLHGIPTSLVGLAVAAALFAGGWLGRQDLGRIDWSTLILIAGGLVLGRLAEHSGLIESIANGVRWDQVPKNFAILGFVTAAAVLSALMSNTASAALLIPIALGVGLPPSVAVLIAIGTVFGAPFVISSPPNAMAYGEGGLRGGDLMRVGFVLMAAGCLLVGLTGPAFLRWVGFP